MDAYGNLSRHLNAYRKLAVLDFDEHAATEFHQLLALRLRIGNMDLLIASIVLLRSAILLTRNKRHFSKVPGLRFEDWSV